VKFGDVVRWRDDGTGDFLACRYMVIGPGKLGLLAELRIEVICLVPPWNSKWEVGETAPCRADKMEVVQ